VGAVRDRGDQRGGDDADNDEDAARDAWNGQLVERMAWIDVPACDSEKPYGSKI
jgi:hypothetical protein